MSDNDRSVRKHTLEISDEEAFLLADALQVVLDSERGQGKSAEILEGIYGRLPETDMVWSDVEND